MLDILPKDLMNIVLDYYLPDYRKMYDEVVYAVEPMYMRIRSLNKTTIGWDEIIDLNLSPDDAIIMWWRHDKPEQLEKALDKKMKPVLKMLAESRATGPGISDILGGIGYIIGLVGIAAYFHSRKKKD